MKKQYNTACKNVGTDHGSFVPSYIKTILLLLPMHYLHDKWRLEVTNKRENSSS